MSGELTKGIKNDSRKIKVELLSRIWLLGTAAVLTSGAVKYSADNWRLGMERRRLVGAALRHLLAYMDGEDLDPETGMSHIFHASCELMFIAELHETRPELDDRFKVDPTAMNHLIKQLDECLSKVKPKGG